MAFFHPVLGLSRLPGRRRLRGGFRRADAPCFQHPGCYVGEKNDRYRHFGTFAARTDDALNFIPARLILPCISFSALMVKGISARRALTMGWAFRNAHASPNSAWSEAAFAGALGLRLGGPVSYKGIPANYPWIGTGRTKASASDLALAIRLMWTTAVTGTLAFTLLLLFAPRL